jgi:hypothetical protein
LGCTEGGGDGVSGDAGDGGHRIGDYFAVLDVEALDFVEGAGGGSGTGKELLMVLVDFLKKKTDSYMFLWKNLPE